MDVAIRAYMDVFIASPEVSYRATSVPIQIRSHFPNSYLVLDHYASSPNSDERFTLVRLVSTSKASKKPKNLGFIVDKSLLTVHK
jgi:hypothetical protein